MLKLLVFLAFVFPFAGFSQAKIEFSDTTFNVTDTIPYGIQKDFEFSVKNTGNEILVISTVKGNLPCTQVKEPLKPGESSTIKCRCNTTRPGPRNTTATVTSNAANKNVRFIRFIYWIGKKP